MIKICKRCGGALKKDDAINNFGVVTYRCTVCPYYIKLYLNGEVLYEYDENQVTPE